MSSSEPWRNPPPAPQLDELRSRIPPNSMFPGWLHAWWPALLCAIMISVLSTDTFSAEHTGTVLSVILHWLKPDMNWRQFDFIHLIVRKSAHFIEYFIFYLLLYRGIRGARQGWHWSWALTAWGIAAFYSILDEVHQMFVASRGPSAWDSLLDSTSAFIGLIVLFLYFRYRKSSAAE
jgi:VanZ family protein